MNDYISRQAAIEAIAQREASGVLTVSGVYPIIGDIPAADAVEVVRCKDCRFKYPRGFCESSLGLLGYCSKGERAEA